MEARISFWVVVICEILLVAVVGALAIVVNERLERSGSCAGFG